MRFNANGSYYRYSWRDPIWSIQSYGTYYVNEGIITISYDSSRKSIWPYSVVSNNLTIIGDTGVSSTYTKTYIGDTYAYSVQTGTAIRLYPTN